MTRHWGVTEKEELEMLQLHVPRLFDNAGYLLYVGANQLRPPHHVETLRFFGWSCHLLEIFPGNVDHHKRLGLFDTITEGDIRTAALPQKGYDVGMWWHGCEHIPRSDMNIALMNLERASDFVVLGCPHGESPQGPEYGNVAETHQWNVWPIDLQKYGYNVVAYECVGRRHLLAWKEIDGSG